MIDVAKLIACGVGPTQARVFAKPLEDTFFRFSIGAGQPQAAFIAQCMHESANFTRLEESTYYSKPETIHNAFRRLRDTPLHKLVPYCKNPKALANLAYAHKNGNGNEASGDGWRYRGRGVFQLTGLGNYLAAGDALQRDYKNNPERVAQPEDAVLTAGWFWNSLRLSNTLAMSGIDGVSKRINGGTNGLEDRRELYKRCIEVLG